MPKPPTREIVIPRPSPKVKHKPSNHEVNLHGGLKHLGKRSPASPCQNPPHKGSTKHSFQTLDLYCLVPHGGYQIKTHKSSSQTPKPRAA